MHFEQIGCHINNVFIGALAYADDVTIICPSIRGLNKMLELCSNFANSNHIYFNAKKTICIKFGEPRREHEKALLNDKYLLWDDKVKHLGNIVSNTGTDLIECTSKKSTRYVN